MATSPKKMTVGEAEMLQEAKDRKMAPKLEKAYNESLTSTAPSPAPAASERRAKGGYIRSADGITQRGKTRGTMVMCGGGMSRGKK